MCTYSYCGWKVFKIFPLYGSDENLAEGSYVKIVLKLGGSVAAPTMANLDYIKRVSSEVRCLVERKHRLGVVVGGGPVAREYIRLGRQLGAGEAWLDILGIEVARVNARVFILGLGGLAYPEPVVSYAQASSLLRLGVVPVMGGTHPGQSTDAVAATLAECVDADLLVMVSDVNGVYSEDPKKSREAVKFDYISYDELLDLVSTSKCVAGVSTVVDPLAARIIKRAGMDTLILGREDSEKLSKIVLGEEEHSGTRIGQKPSRMV